MNIKKDSNNDYLALTEAIQRRCKNLQKNNLDLPEVILIRWRQRSIKYC